MLTIVTTDPGTAAAAVRRHIRGPRHWLVLVSVLQHLLVLSLWLGRSRRATEIDEAAHAIVATRLLVATRRVPLQRAATSTWQPQVWQVQQLQV
jgi:hypothetical protein